VPLPLSVAEKLSGKLLLSTQTQRERRKANKA
jgi:hypothetical protein